MQNVKSTAYGFGIEVTQTVECKTNNFGLVEQQAEFRMVITDNGRELIDETHEAWTIQDVLKKAVNKCEIFRSHIR